MSMKHRIATAVTATVLSAGAIVGLAPGASAAIPSRNDGTYNLTAYRAPDAHSYYAGQLQKLSGAGCFYVERRNTSNNWTRTNFQYQVNGSGSWYNTDGDAYDCSEGGDWYRYRVWNGSDNGVTGIRFTNPDRGLVLNMCLGAADCQTLRIYGW